MVGNNGLSAVETNLGSEGITFVEKLSSGSLQTTTIALDGSAVHSRNTIIIGKVLGSQYIGTCLVSEQ